MRISQIFNDILFKLSHSEQKENRNLNICKEEGETFVETKRRLCYNRTDIAIEYDVLQEAKAG